MSNIYLKAPTYLPYYPSLDRTKTIFLAGSITGASDWQEEGVGKLIPHFNVFNPRRSTYLTMQEGIERQQISWEYFHLEIAGITLFYFAPETLAPITLLEYGKQLEKVKYAPWRKTYVCINPDYKRKSDVIIQTELENKDILDNMFSDLSAMYAKIIKDHSNKD